MLCKWRKPEDYDSWKMRWFIYKSCTNTKHEESSLAKNLRTNGIWDLLDFHSRVLSQFWLADCIRRILPGCTRARHQIYKKTHHTSLNKTFLLYSIYDVDCCLRALFSRGIFPFPNSVLRGTFLFPQEDNIVESDSTFCSNDGIQLFHYY